MWDVKHPIKHMQPARRVKKLGHKRAANLAFCAFCAFGFLAFPLAVATRHAELPQRPPCSPGDADSPSRVSWDALCFGYTACQ